MRIGLWVDMVGAGGIDDYRACLPAFPHYWETGRAALTADVIATAEGLLAGGATSVSVVDIHGPDIWPRARIAAKVASRPLDAPACQLDLTSPAVVRDGNPDALRQLRDRFDA